MRAIRCRSFRQQAYKGRDFRDRQYFHSYNRYGTMKARYVTVTDKEGKEKQVPVVATIEADTFRQVYQHLKQSWKERRVNNNR